MARNQDWVSWRGWDSESLLCRLKHEITTPSTGMEIKATNMSVKCLINTSVVSVSQYLLHIIQIGWLWYQWLPQTFKIFYGSIVLDHCPHLLLISLPWVSNFFSSPCYCYACRPLMLLVCLPTTNGPHSNASPRGGLENRLHHSVLAKSLWLQDGIQTWSPKMSYRI